MEFFSSWAFIILMAALLLILTVGMPLIVLFVVIRMSRNQQRRDRNRGEIE